MSKSFNIKVKSKPYLRIELNVAKDFISKHNLQEVVINCHEIHHPEIYQMMINLEGKQKIKFPFTFPPKFPKHSKEYLIGFLTLYEDMVREIDKAHHDNILFLAYSYFLENKSNRKKTFKEDDLRKKGNILLDLIKVEIPKLNATNIYHILENDPLYDDHTPQEYFLAYLSVASGKNEREFLLDPTNPHSEVDFKKIDEQLWNDLTDRIQKHRNITIPVPFKESRHTPRLEKGHLTVSKDIIIDFKIGDKSAVSKKLDRNHSADLLELLMKQLLEEQFIHDTDFYHTILNKDSVIKTEEDLKLMSSSLGEFIRNEHKSRNLEALYKTLMSYLESNELLKGTDDIITKRKRDNFIFQYFLLLNLHANVKTTLNKGENTIDFIKQSLEEFKVNKAKKVDYASTSLQSVFSNNKRNIRKYRNRSKVRL